VDEPRVTLAREALPLVAVLLLAAVLLGAVFHPWAAVVPVPFLLFTLWFFRDPRRVTPADPDALISPADGRIIVADADRVSVFMNVFNVHVCRTPMAGTVESVRHHPGRFLAAYREEAPTANERLTIRVVRGTRRLEFTLIAGLIARRIVCRVEEDRELRAGERIGLIQFGSRVDLRLPPGAEPAAEIGQRVRAGETVLARFVGDEPG
jgi:phosphatidylserine decarboxylase